MHRHLVWHVLYGLVTFFVVETLGGLRDKSQETMSAAAKGGLDAFLYLAVLDASFSIDGVIGAFALSNNLFVIAIGLGIGAMYVRCRTIMLSAGTAPTRTRRSTRADQSDLNDTALRILDVAGRRP